MAQQTFIGILNDVLGPIMRGPSSSHTAGAYRIALLCSAILGSKPVKVHCYFDPDGSYAATYVPLGVDLAMAAALMGWEMTDPRYESSLLEVAASGVDLRFFMEKLDHADHPNAVRMDLEGPENVKVRVWARSIGGGVVEIYRINDSDLLITGKSRHCLVFMRPDASPESAVEVARILGARHLPTGGGGLIDVEIEPDIRVDIAAILANVDVEGLRLIEPVFFVQRGSALFQSAEEALLLAKEGGWSLGEIARRFEAQLLGRSPESIDRETLELLRIMENSVRLGLEAANVHMPLLGPTAAEVLNAEKDGRLPVGGPLVRAAARAMATMHICNSRGVICAAPTGGSAGVLPGVLLTLREDLGFDDAGLVRALLAAGAVGLVVALRATFAAEVAGCQVEIGVAGAMAAAAVVEAAGGSAAQACNAAAIALQNTMGSVCDPVQGGCEIPCQTRNAVAASNAFVCADLILGGYLNPIPLDETIDASYAVGRSLPAELRCTARGGIAATPSARALGSHMK
jgi:L-serine dehydratase